MDESDNELDDRHIDPNDYRQKSPSNQFEEEEKDTAIDKEKRRSSSIHDANILENRSVPKIKSFMQNITCRQRVEVQLKRPKPVKQFCISIRDTFYKCFVKCGIKQQSKAALEPPPNRYIYWGPQYDIIKNELYDDARTTKPPHFKDQDNMDDYPKGSKFVSNYISTTKYTVLTFLPLNLFEQFRKKANLYFLIIACLALFPFSPKNPIFSWLPLLFVLAVSAVKEAFEDYKRYQMDKEINNRPIDTFRPDNNGMDWKFRKIQWEEVQVGDMIRITEDEPFFPADCLLLQSSTNKGLCNIETASLDGETNLKIKQALGKTYSLPTDEKGDDYCLNDELQFKLESEAPNEDMAKWQGNVQFYGDQDDEAISAGMNQMILRGCTLKNTDWIIAIVVATGTETKISLNNKKTKFKRSNVCFLSTVLVITLIVCSLFVISLFCFITNKRWILQWIMDYILYS